MVSLVIECRPLNPAIQGTLSFFNGKAFVSQIIQILSPYQAHPLRKLTSQHLALRPLTELQKQAAFILAPYLNLEDSPDPPLQIYIDICSLQNQHCLEIYGAHTLAHAKEHT